VTSPLTATTQAPITVRVQTRTQAVIEDCEWMARCGETLTGAATRCGYKDRDVLERVLQRAGRPDLVTTLKTAEHLASGPEPGRRAHRRDRQSAAHT